MARSACLLAAGTVAVLAFGATPAVPEAAIVENDGRRGEYVYVSAYLPSPGPGDGSYALTIATRRR